MNKILVLEQFEQIEQKVGNILEINKSLELSNKEFKNRIKILESELQDKIEAEKIYMEERSMVLAKIDNLLGILGDIDQVDDSDQRSVD